MKKFIITIILGISSLGAHADTKCEASLKPLIGQVYDMHFKIPFVITDFIIRRKEGLTPEGRWALLKINKDLWNFELNGLTIDRDKFITGELKRCNEPVGRVEKLEVDRWQMDATQI
jgi:hypothetical protein